jgi:hypothetical protein
MRTNVLMAGIISAAIGFTLPHAAFSAETPAKSTVTEKDVAGPPDATVKFEAEQFRLIFGGSGGKGVLTYKGKDYPFTMKGASVGGVGVSKVEGTAVVHNLKNVEDFSGHYVGIGIGAAVTSAGKGASSFQNNKGVIVSTRSKAEGLALNAGVNAIDVTLSK